MVPQISSPIFKKEILKFPENDIINNEKKLENQEESKKNKFLGIIIVVLITVSYSTLNELSQFLLSGSYNAPFMMTWFNTLFFLFSFFGEPLIIKWELYREKKKLLKNLKNNEKIPEFDTVKERYLNNFKITSTYDQNGKVIKKGISLKKLFIISFPMSILFVGLSWIWTMGISMTEVNISTALYQSATLFCFILSIVILKEKIRFLKTLSVVVFISGIIGITVATFGTTTGSYPHALTGYILLVSSAALWALYEVLTSKFIGECSRTILHTYMGFIALFNLFLGIPIIAIFNKTGVEHFMIPDGNTFGLLFLNGAISYGVNYLINWGLSVTSPLFVRAGELMTIPATLVFDLIFKHIKFPLTAIPGYILIVIGFILSVIINYRQIKKQSKLEKQQNEIKNNQKININNEKDSNYSINNI